MISLIMASKNKKKQILKLIEKLYQKQYLFKYSRRYLSIDKKLKKFPLDKIQKRKLKSINN
jgi:hypothetical protein